MDEREIVKLDPPVGKDDAFLPLENLQPKTFEHFCCELIKKRLENEDDELIDAMTIGISGQSQFGADIISHCRRDGQDYYSLYEVKRNKKFGRKEYQNTVERFVRHREKWQVKINEFSIFLSEKASAELIAAVKQQQGEFRQLNIVHRLLDVEMIHDWLEELYCPDLLYRFCHDYWVERFYGERALLDLKSYGLWHYQESSTWRNYQQPYLKIQGDFLMLQNDHIFIQAFLPTLQSHNLSCFVDLRNGRYAHVLLTLSKKTLLKTAFEGAGTPAEAELRPWVMKEHQGEHYYCDIGNCRLKLTLKETRALCDAFDGLWQSYKQRMQEIERMCRSADFPLTDTLGDNIQLMTIPLWLWNRISTFCERHDYLDTSGEWSIFNPLNNHIMVMTRKADDSLNEGHHVTLQIRRDPDYYSVNNQRVAVIWQPPGRFDFEHAQGDAISPRNYWDVLTTWRWLMEKLIPAADSWFVSRYFPERRGWRRLPFCRARHAGYIPQDIYSRYRPEENIQFSDVDSKESLLALLTALQYFYHGHADRLCFKAGDFQQLCDAFLLLLDKTTVDHWGYIRGSVGARQDNREAVVAALEKYRAESRDNDNRMALFDHLFRGMMALYGDGECHINDVEAVNVATLLRPYAEAMTEGRFLRRCQNRL